MSIFKGVEEYRLMSLRLVGDEHATRSIAGVSAGMFQMLGLHPYIGRLFRPLDGHPTQNDIAVLSYEFWRAWFGGDSSAIGHSIRLLGDRGPVDYRVVGILPSGESFPPASDVDVYVPLGSSAADSSTFWATVLARTKEGVSLALAQSAVAASAASHGNEDRDELHQILVRSQSSAEVLRVGRTHVNAWHYYEEPTPDPLKPAILTLMMIGIGLVVALACINGALLQIVQAERSRQEVAIREVLGSPPWMSYLDAMIDGVVTAVLGTAIGFCLLAADRRVLRGPGLDASLEPGLVKLAVLIILVFAVIAVLLPAVSRRRMSVREALGHAHAVPGSSREFVRSARFLVGVALATTVTATTCASGILESIVQLNSIRKGFDPVNVIAFHFANQSDAPEAAVRTARQESLDGVQHTQAIRLAAIGNPPGSGDIEDVQIDVVGGVRSVVGFASVYFVSPDYFRTLEVPLVAGQVFSASADSDGVADVVLGESVARHLTLSNQYLGHLLRISLVGRPKPIEARLVGIVADLNGPPNAGVGPITKQIYLPIDLSDQRSWWILAREVPRTRRELAKIANDYGGRRYAAGVTAVKLADLLDSANRTANNGAIQVASFAVGGLIAVALGLYALLAYEVGLRRHEIGIRMALGASPGDIRRVFLKHVLRMMVPGLVAGWIGALAAYPLLRHVTVGASSIGWIAYVAGPAVVMVVCLGAVYRPLQMASKTSPNSILERASSHRK